MNSCHIGCKRQLKLVTPEDGHDLWPKYVEFCITNKTLCKYLTVKLCVCAPSISSRKRKNIRTKSTERGKKIRKRYTLADKRLSV